MIIAPRFFGPWFYADECPTDIRGVRRVQSDIDYGIEVAWRGRNVIVAWRSRKLWDRASMPDWTGKRAGKGLPSRVREMLLRDR